MWARLILALIYLAPHVQGLVVVNANDPQNPCPPRGSCLVDDAVCDTGSGDCVCGGNFTNQPMDGRLDCYRDTERFARVVNDPRVKVFDKDTYKFLLPCRVLLSDVFTSLRTREGGSVGKCLCSVFFWNKKQRGKIILHGFDFTCKIRRYQPPVLYKKFTTRIYGQGNGTNYVFVEQGSFKFADNSPQDNVRVSINQNGIVYQSEYDLVNNRVILDFWSCGHRVTFSPYDIETHVTSQSFLPGLSVAVDTAVSPKFFSKSRVMATGPSDLGGLPIESALLDGLDLQTSFLFRALRNTIPPQSQPNANSQCSRGKSVLRKCFVPDLKIAAQERCNFLFEYAKLMNCLDDTSSGEKLLELYLDCVDYVCSLFKRNRCITFLNKLISYSASCPPAVTAAVPEYQLYVNGTWECPQ